MPGRQEEFPLAEVESNIVQYSSLDRDLGSHCERIEAGVSIIEVGWAPCLTVAPHPFVPAFAEKPGDHSRRLWRLHDRSNRVNHRPLAADTILMLAPESADRLRKPRRPHGIKSNLMESTDCEPTLASRSSAISRHVDRAFDPSRNDTN